MTPTRLRTLFNAARRRSAALALAAVTTLAVLASMVQLADAFLNQAGQQQQAAEPAALPVVAASHADGRG